MAERYFFEIPMYRISKERFNRGYQRDLERFWADVMHQSPGDASAEQRARINEHFAETYGAPWRYNQAVGWVRLYVLGTQIRADYWLSNAQRLQRTAQRKFRWSVNGFEMSCDQNESNGEILKRVRTNLKQLRRELRNGRLTLDFECFENAAPYFDWHKLVFAD